MSNDHDDADSLLKKLNELDDIVSREANGCYTVPEGKDAPRYKVRQLFEYAAKKGKNTSELTDEELKMFEIPKKQTGQDQVTMLIERLESLEKNPETGVKWRDIRRSGGIDISTLDLKVIGQRLKDARNRSGFTLAQVETHTGINATQLSDLENGKGPLGLGVLQTLADLYGYALEQIQDVSRESLGPGIEIRITELRKDIPLYLELAKELLESNKISYGKYEELLIAGGYGDILFPEGERLAFREEDLMSHDPLVVSQAKEFLNNLDFMRKVKATKIIDDVCDVVAKIKGPFNYKDTMQKLDNITSETRRELSRKRNKKD